MYTPCRNIETFYISGFQRYNGMTVLDQIKAGTVLDLTAETDNPYDPQAVMISYKGVKLGYIPRGSNFIASLLLYFGHKDTIECIVTKVDPSADPWEQVRVSLFITDPENLEGRPVL